MADFIVMVGIAGSGKSFHAARINKEKYDGKAVIISSDKIRKELFGNEDYQGNPELVFEEVHKRISEAVRYVKNIIVDATNLRAIHREEYLMLTIGYEYRAVAVVVNTPLEISKQQNAARKRKVPVQILEKQTEQLQWPSRREGFDKVCKIRL